MKKGMIKGMVMYPNGEGKKFDLDYYCNKHLPLVAGLLGDSLKGSAVDKGLAGGAPGLPAPYAAVGTLYFDSIEAFETAFGPHMETIMADLPNYTNIEPILLISEVIN